MSKAIQGAAAFGGALAMGVAAFYNPALLASPWFSKLMAGLVMSGISSETAAIADALTANRGQNIMIRQPASNREIIRGEWRTGGTLIYPSTTGGAHRQYNRIIVLATHEIDSITGLYLDGRKVYFTGSGPGNTTRNGVNFGGNADSSNHRGPDGSNYNFGDLVFCDVRYGDQTSGDVMGTMTANDPTWATSSAGNPYVGGCAYVYLKIRYDENQFPGDPEIRFAVRGKNDIYDPRTGTRGWTNNWALLVADLLVDPKWGYGHDYETEINEEQLIAAANVCDEGVALASGLFERRYTFNWKHDTSVSPGDVLTQMMASAAGRYTWVGGQYHIFPAYWMGPTFTFDDNDLAGEPTWKPTKALDKRCNRVIGTYTAPNYPYNVVGNLYNHNGWFEGSTFDYFPFGFQPSSYPMYAADPLHGYPIDQYLAEDSGAKGAWDSGTTYGRGLVVTHNGGIWRSLITGNLNHEPSSSSEQWAAYSVILPKEVALPGVLSVTQAQRVAKIVLMRNRAGGSGTFPMMMRAYKMAPQSVMQFTFPKMGWIEKTLEITNTVLSVETGSGEGASPELRFSVDVQETSPDIYEWSIVEELTPYAVPALPDTSMFSPALPRNMTLTSGVATAVISPTGEAQPRIKVSWDVPLDGLAKRIEIRYRPTGTDWIDAPSADVSSLYSFISNVVAGNTYDVQIRSLRGTGATSEWVEIDGYTVSLTLSTLSLLALAQSHLIGEAYPDGTAGIEVTPFALPVGGHTANYLPSGAYTIHGLTQSQLWYVYVVDTTFSGGDLIPVATQSTSDFLNKQGYIFLGSLKTPMNSGGGGGSGRHYFPSLYNDVGSRTVGSAAAAYDGNMSTKATISATYSEDSFGIQTFAVADVFYNGFPSVVLSADATLHVFHDVSLASGMGADIIIHIAGVISSVAHYTSSATGVHATYTIPTGTNLADIFVQLTLDPSGITYVPGTTVYGQIENAELYIEV